MKIIYSAKHGNKGSDDTEGHISRSLEKLGHEVIRVREGDPVPQGDLLLFHKSAPDLKGFRGLKACWYFDKIAWNDRERWVRSVLPDVDLFFLTDGTWARENPDPKLRVLRQGIGDMDTRPGRPRRGVWKAQICLLGGVYGERYKWAVDLKKRYGEAFRVYGDVFNRDLYDLCETVPIILAPPYPSDDGYWSNRIYLTLGSGGFLIHPRLEGLREEYEDGYHYVGYSSHEELVKHIDHYLTRPEERDKIRENGRKKTLTEYNFTERCHLLLREIARLKPTGTTG